MGAKIKQIEGLQEALSLLARKLPRVLTIESAYATPAINTDLYDSVVFSNINTAITSMTSNLSGTPTDTQSLLVVFKDDGTARAITWGSKFVSMIATLPTTTTAGKYTYVGLKYNDSLSQFACLAAGVQP